jgi:DNA-binding CsgD family transcriptional regulator
VTTAATAPPRPLTARQLDILDTIRRRHADRRQAFTPRQLATRTGISAGAIYAELRYLRELGWLQPARQDAPDATSAAPDGPMEATGTLTRPVLTPRQREILTLAADGLTNAKIGARLHLTPSTVKGHISSATTALGATNRTHAVATALRTGIIR